MAAGKTRWFQERLCGFRLGGCFRKWFQERLGGVSRVGLAHLFVVPERSPHPTQEQHFSTIFSLFKSSSLFIMHISTQTIS